MAPLSALSVVAVDRDVGQSRASHDGDVPCKWGLWPSWWTHTDAGSKDVEGWPQTFQKGVPNTTLFRFCVLIGLLRKHPKKM